MPKPQMGKRLKENSSVSLLQLEILNNANVARTWTKLVQVVIIQFMFSFFQ